MAHADLSELFDLFPIPSLILSPSYQIQRVSQSFLNELKISKDICVDQDLLTFLDQKTGFVRLEKLEQALSEAIRTRSVRTVEVTRAKGRPPMSTRIAPIFKDDTLLWLVLEWTEVIEGTQPAEQKPVSLSTLSPPAQDSITVRYPGLDACAKHELRSSINGILGMCSVLLDTALNQDQQLLVQTTQRCTETLSEALGVQVCVFSEASHASDDNRYHHLPDTRCNFSTLRPPHPGLPPQRNPPSPAPRRQLPFVNIAALAEGLKDLAQGKKILLAEDNMVNQRIMLKYLQKLGFDRKDIDLACNGEEAVTMVCTDPAAYALVFMDIAMPVMDGFDATARIRARGVTVTIVAMSASGMREDLEHCLQMGMNDTILKPFTARAIADVLWKWLPTVRRAKGVTPVVVRSLM